MGREGDGGKALAIIKCLLSNAGHTAGDSDRGQAIAMLKCLLSNAGHTAGDGDRS